MEIAKFFNREIFRLGVDNEVMLKDVKWYRCESVVISEEGKFVISKGIRK